jgi:hypothetical protein
MPLHHFPLKPHMVGAPNKAWPKDKNKTLHQTKYLWVTLGIMGVFYALKIL